MPQGKTWSKEVAKLKYLLGTSMRCSEKRKRWIEKAHHLDGCTYSDDGYLKSAKCSCGKRVLTKEFEKGVLE